MKSSAQRVSSVFKKAIISAALALIASATTANADPAIYAQGPVTLANTERHVFRSEVNGVEYQLTVVLPPDYDKNTQTHYPTFYIMDGDRWASLLAVLLPRFTENAGFPPFIVVGVDYPGKTGRYQDYGPISQIYFPVPENRGWRNFMRVIKQEIIPFIERGYRTDTNDRGIGGHSMGGLFTSYALLHENDTFRRFWISSPSLFYDSELIFKDFIAFQKKAISNPLYVFMDVGSDELPSMQSALTRFGMKAVNAHPEQIVLKSLVVPDTEHATVVPSVIAPAFDHLYSHRQHGAPATDDLVRYSGEYQFPESVIARFVTDGRDLMYGDNTVDYERDLVKMYATSTNRFYKRGSPLEFEFPSGTEAPAFVRVHDMRRKVTFDAPRILQRDTKSKQSRPEVKLGRP